MDDTAETDRRDHHTCPDHHGLSRRGSGHRRRLVLTLVLALVYMVAEIVGGLVTQSLALLADAGHMFSDVAALGLSLFAVWVAERPATSQRTYGYYRAEILAALAQGVALVTVSVFIFVEAYRRLGSPPHVDGPLMTAIATGGLAVNLVQLWILHGGRRANLNLMGAWLHVLSDALGSLGTIVAAALIWAFEWHWSDIAASVVIGGLIIVSSWRLLAESVAVLMEGAPRGINVDDVLAAMREARGVAGVHDLHVWTITSGLESLSAHVVAIDGQAHSELLTRIRTLVHERFGIDHVTIQIEPENFSEQGACG
jgi:cobalt-zinc-cadmium efflux system protein